MKKKIKLQQAFAACFASRQVDLSRSKSKRYHVHCQQSLQAIGDEYIHLVRPEKLEALVARINEVDFETLARPALSTVAAPKNNPPNL